MAMLECIDKHSGLISIALTIFIPLAGIFIRQLLFRPQLKLEDLKEPTLCSSFDVLNKAGGAHRTAFLVYLRVTNIGRTPVQIGDIHLGYRSAENADGESFRWLRKETPMLEDFKLPMNDREVKVFPFLKQSQSSTNTSIKTYLHPGEYVNGLVYFEQTPSIGLDYPYMDPDHRVITKIRVHDTSNRYWEIEFPVYKVQIDVIREMNPRFGRTLDYVASGND